MKKFIKISYWTVIHLFAVVGFVFVGVFFAIRLKLTNVKGTVDGMSSSFQQEADQTKVLGVATSGIDSIDEITKLSETRSEKIKVICELNELSYVAPGNVKKIIEQRKAGVGGDVLTEKMVFAIKTKMGDTSTLDLNINKCVSDFEKKPISETEIDNRLQNTNSADIFNWINYKEWSDAKVAITKDELVLKKAAGMVDMDPRLIASNLMVEQLRLYFSVRELYKQYFEPLKVLSNSNKISLGVMAVKEETAKDVENHLKDKTSPYYLGEKYEHLLDYQSNDVAKIRYERLMDNTHYYSYLYAAIYLKQMMKQWSDSGFSIDDRPEIICTLYNVGFPQSKPNASPKIGGSTVKIGTETYSFGRLAFEFFYSGELSVQFPYLIK